MADPAPPPSKRKREESGDGERESKKKTKTNAHDNPKLRKIKGIGSKIRGYLESISPEVKDAQSFLAAYPHMETFMEAITGSKGGDQISKRSLGSLRGNLRKTYEWLNAGSTLLQTSEVQPTTKVADEIQTGADQSVMPAGLVRPTNGATPIVNEPILDQIAAEKDMDQPFGRGKETPETGEGMENVRDPVPTYSQRLKTHPNVSALTVERALDLAEMDPIKPTKELTTLPTHVDNAILTQQEEYYLEHKNSNSLTQSSMATPAAALTTNNGDGVREGIRRRDTDIEVAAEEEESKDEIEDNGGAKGKGRGGRGKGLDTVGGAKDGGKSLRKFEFQKPNDRLVRSIQWLGRGLDSLNSKVAGQVRTANQRRAVETAAQRQREWIEAHRNSTDVDGNTYTEDRLRRDANIAHPSASLMSQPNTLVNAAESATSDVIRGTRDLMDKFIGSRDLMLRAKAHNISAEEVELYIRNVGEQRKNLTGERGPEDADTTDELRPFLPIAGAADVELGPGDNQQKKRTEALFSDYKPPNWPLGSTDNALHLHNLILKGIHWLSPLDSIPPVLQGGSLTQGVHEYSDYVPTVSPEDLSLLAIHRQMCYKLKSIGKRLIHRGLLDSASEFRGEVVNDVKFLFNPMAMGANNAQVFTPNELNPLVTPMHLDLQVGGSEPLYNLFGPCNAFSTIEQPGGAPIPPPIQSHIQGQHYNLYTTRPKYH